MPRKETLAAITPNRYYHLEATLKYIHQTENLITAIIEQDNIQRKIKFPKMMAELQEGAQYSFEKCFYSNNGWIKVDDADKIKLMEPKANQFLTLNEIYDSRADINDHYVTTVLHIIEVGQAEKKMKEGKELTLTTVKGFADNSIIDITVWNRDISADLVGKTVIVEGVRVKLLTHASMVLVSSVYTKIHQIEGHLQQEYNPRQTYRLISQVYVPKTIEQSQRELQANQKSFSIVTASIEDILIFDYEGCTKCRKKLETQACQICGQGFGKTKYWVAQLLLKDETGQIVTFVFDDKLLGTFRLAKKGSSIRGRIKSTVRNGSGDEKIVSNVLTGINSIQF